MSTITVALFGGPESGTEVETDKRPGETFIHNGRSYEVRDRQEDGTVFAEFVATVGDDQ